MGTNRIACSDGAFCTIAIAHGAAGPTGGKLSQQGHSARPHPVKVRFGLTTSDPCRPNYNSSIAILGSDDGAHRSSEALVVLVTQDPRMQTGRPTLIE
jgi:hypothetical protein